MLTTGLATTVTIGGKPAAVVGSKGLNATPHPGLHPSDPKLVPAQQEAEIVAGSATVTFDGLAAAYSTCRATACLAPAPVVTGTAATVLVGS